MTKCEVYSRVVGYLRPVQQWNPGKLAEYSERVEFRESDDGSVVIPGDVLAGMMTHLLNHLSGHTSEDIHEQADDLRTRYDLDGVLAGEVLEMLATMRDHLMGVPIE